MSFWTGASGGSRDGQRHRFGLAAYLHDPRLKGSLGAKLSEYLERAARGERIVICRHNKPVAELRPLAPALTTPRKIGPIPGRPTFELPPSFFEPQPADEIDQWEGVPASDPLSPRRRS